MIGSRKYTKQIITSDRSIAKLVQDSTPTQEPINSSVTEEISELNKKLDHNKDRDNSVLRVMTDLNNQLRQLKQEVSQLKQDVSELKKQ
jgi:predicted RNase H-like nuclease (RuvC/YqgF family)